MSVGALDKRIEAHDTILTVDGETATEDNILRLLRGDGKVIYQSWLRAARFRERGCGAWTRASVRLGLAVALQALGDLTLFVLAAVQVGSRAVITVQKFMPSPLSGSPRFAGDAARFSPSRSLLMIVLMIVLFIVLAKQTSYTFRGYVLSVFIVTAAPSHGAQLSHAVGSSDQCWRILTALSLAHAHAQIVCGGYAAT